MRPAFPMSSLFGDAPELQRLLTCRGAPGGWRGGTWSYRLPLEPGSNPGSFTLGGPDQDPERNQVGYAAPPTNGLLSIAFPNGRRPGGLLTVDIDQGATTGIVLQDVDLPIYSVQVTCPVRLTVRPHFELTEEIQVHCGIVPGNAPPGAGLHQTRALPSSQDPVMVPQWARAIAGPFVGPPTVIELAPSTGVFSGEFVPNVGQPVALPGWARWVRVSAAVPNAWAVFLGAIL